MVFRSLQVALLLSISMSALVANSVPLNERYVQPTAPGLFHQVLQYIFSIVFQSQRYTASLRETQAALLCASKWVCRYRLL